MYGQLSTKGLRLPLIFGRKAVMIKKVWNKIRNSKHWERRMGWEYFALIALGSLIAGIFAGMG